MFLVVTLGGCSGRTRWSSSLDCSPTYTTTTVAVPLESHGHVSLPECSYGHLTLSRDLAY